MTEQFTPRTKCPTKSDLWYCRSGYGGESPCIAGKPERWKGSVLSNCVGYSFGRVAELMGRFIKIGYTYGNKPYSAHHWADAKDGLERGEVPKLGAVCCWIRTDGEIGHVANVEKIYQDGSWQSSESAYGGSAWKTRKYNKKSYRKGFIFQTFIYLPKEFAEETRIPNGTKVKIIGTGCANSFGTGRKTTTARGWTRVVLGYAEGRPYPYKVGIAGIPTAWYKEKDLKIL